VPHGSATAREEVFGPVACVFRVANTEEAITLANHTAFGLGASLWTRSRATADALIPRLDAGAVFVNSMVKSDPRLPFGGTKRSGVGRELSREGILAFMNAKTVTIET
jgi:succinate-semialdehyde dehydrogenase/glutarate-semialdehyde dehydrogenase